MEDPNGHTNGVRIRYVFENYKNTRDVRRNLKALEKAWKQDRTQRGAFYLGNSYKDMKDLGKAAEWYAVVVDEFPTVNNENRFKSLETICEIYLIGVPDIEDLGARAMQMIEEYPDRPEGYFYRARYQFITKNYHMAKKCLMQVMRMLATPSLTMKLAILTMTRMLKTRNCTRPSILASGLTVLVSMQYRCQFIVILPT